MAPEPECEVILPVHNEAASIEGTIRGIYAQLSATISIVFIVCEDGSTDDSKQILRHLAGELPIRLNLTEDRKGYSLAMREGMAMAEAAYVLCLDGDGQCDPRDFPAFWRKRAEADVVIGWRTHRSDPFLRRIFSRLFYVIYQLFFHTPVHDPSCPYVLFRREIAHRMAKELGAMREGFWWEFVARAFRHSYRIEEIPIRHRERTAGVTQVYKWRKMPDIFWRHVLALSRIRRETTPQP